MRRMTCLAYLILAAPAVATDPVRFERIVIDDDFPGGYQVEVADVDGDKKPDLVALGGKTLAWYQNPTWKKRVIVSGALPSDIISSATLDIDGDGKAEIAVACDFAMNEPTRGLLVIGSQGATIDDGWTLRVVAKVPSIHRLRWGNVTWRDKPTLVVAPLFGPKAKPPTYDQDPATLMNFPIPRRPEIGQLARRRDDDPAGPPRHRDRRADARMVQQAARGDEHGHEAGAAGEPVRHDGEQPGNRLVRLQRHRLGPSRRPGTPRSRRPRAEAGSSEVHRGLLADGGAFFATIDPWHGNQVAVVVSPMSKPRQPRLVIDDTLDDGHALWVADVDGDHDDEVFAGHRGKDHRVSMYDFDGKKWNRTVLDTGVAAQDLRGGDLDGDGVPDVVAIGGKTHNLVWYRPIRPAPPRQ